MSDENILNQQTNSEVDSGGIFEILGKLMSNSAPQSNSAQTVEKSGTEPNILSSLLSNPELLSKLPELISVISPLMSSITSQNNSILPTAPSKPSVIASDSASASVSAHAPNRELQNRSALLCALKPYLKKDRQEAIDYMIKLSRLGDILKTL